MCDHYSLDLGVVMQKGQVCLYPEKQSPRPTHFRGRFPFQRRRPVRSPICRAHSAPARGISQIPQLLRVESLVTRCSNSAGNSREISKGEFQNDICRFESSQPSHAVRSLWLIYGTSKNSRHSTRLARLKRARPRAGAWRSPERSAPFRDSPFAKKRFVDHIVCDTTIG